MKLREDAVQIWRSAVAAVDSAQLVASYINCTQEHIQVGELQFPYSRIRHLEIVGAGKAGAGMAQGLETALHNVPHPLPFTCSGWVNVPADCVRPLQAIHLHPARPAGLNEPAAAGVAGTTEILKRVSSLTADDLCLVLLSGGGSALLCLPVAEISLSDKLIVTRALAARGAPIHELNCVRSQLSQVKGGRLATACRAASLITLIISDVVNDPLDVIASGPTVPSTTTASDALRILQNYQLVDGSIPASVVQYLKSRSAADSSAISAAPESVTCRVQNRVIGNNQMALQAAAAQAIRLGYRVISLGSQNQLQAAQEGRLLFQNLQELKRQHGSPLSFSSAVTDGSRGVCLLSGGEPTVRLTPTDKPRSGGRNQELILAAVTSEQRPEEWKNLVLLSGGTDGEDGPTDAAGAVADETLVRRMLKQSVRPEDFLKINNSYPFFKQLDGLLITGPTHTNVMDIRVGLAGW